MTNTDNIISETLGILSSPTKSPITIPKKISLVSTTENDIENDYKYQRENLYNLIERGQDAIDGILELAKEGEHPRAYEVALNGIKQVADVTDKLIDLQDKMKKLKELPNSAPKNVTNALFVGSTAELQKMLKDKSDGWIIR